MAASTTHGGTLCVSHPATPHTFAELGWRQRACPSPKRDGNAFCLLSFQLPWEFHAERDCLFSKPCLESWGLGAASSQAGIWHGVTAGLAQL